MSKKVNPSSNPNHPVECPYCHVLIPKETYQEHFIANHYQTNPVSITREHYYDPRSLSYCTICGNRVSPKNRRKHMFKVHHIGTLEPSPNSSPKRETGSSKEKDNGHNPAGNSDPKPHVKTASYGPRLARSPSSITPINTTCPFCHETLLRKEAEVFNHFKNNHAEIPAAVRNEKLIHLFGPSVKKIGEDIQPADAELLKQLSPRSEPWKQYAIDENGFLVPEQQNQSSSIPHTNHLQAQKKPGSHITVCPICNRTTNDLKDHVLHAHRFLMVNETVFQCLTCKRQLKFQELNRHSCYGTPTKPGKSYRVKSLSALDPKMISPDRDDALHQVVSCKRCGYYYPLGFNHEAYYHPKIKKGTCPFCEKHFKEEIYLVHHIENAHHVKFVTWHQNKQEKVVNPRLVVCILCNCRLHPNEVLEHALTHQNVQISEKLRNEKPPAQHQKKTRTCKRETSLHYSTNTEVPEDRLDGGRYLGWIARENGRFGSLPEYDDYGDEADA